MISITENDGNSNKFQLISVWNEQFYRYSYDIGKNDVLDFSFSTFPADSIFLINEGSEIVKMQWHTENWHMVFFVPNNDSLLDKNRMTSVVS